MKRHLLIGLFFLMALASCHNSKHEARQMVRRAEKLFESDPDSSVSLIDSVLRMPVYFNEKHRMDMALLQAEAIFGDHGDCEIPPLMDDDFFDDKPFLSTSPELERAADYYAQKKQFAKAAHAALYSGFIQKHYSEKQAAMQSFKDTERYGEMAKDSLAVAQAKCLMGKMLFDDYTYSEALSLFISADKCLGKHFVEHALVQNMISVCYMLLTDYENSANCLQRSMVLADENHIDKVKHKVLNNYAVLYRLQGKYNQAIECLKQIGNEPNLTDNEKALICLNIGKVYAATGAIDSATFYYQQLEKTLPDNNMKEESRISAYGALSQFAKSLGNDSLALLYRETHEKLLYEVMHQRQEQNTFRIQRQYDYENLQNILNRKIISKHRIILTISILLLIAAIVILILQFRQKQMRKAELEMRRQIESLKSNLRESVKASYLEHELSSRLRLIISAYRTQKSAHDPQNEWRPLVMHLMNGKKTVFEAVLEEMEKVYPSIYSILRQKYPELNETETKVCLLSCSNLSNMEIAEILEISKHTVDKNRSKLRDKLNLKPDKMNEQLHKVLAC